MSIGATRALAGVGAGVNPDVVVGASVRLALQDGLVAEMVYGDRSFGRYAGCIDDFVATCRGAGVWGSASVWARDVVAQDGIPLAVLLYRGSVLVGIALGSELTVLGRRTRLGVCGNLTGERGFFTTPGGSAGERDRMALAAADAMMGFGLRGVILKLREYRDGRRVGAESAPGVWGRIVGHTRRKVSDTFHAGTSFEESLAVFGAHTRRNLRYYRRRVERELQSEFLPVIDGAMLRQTLVELQSHTDDPVRPGIAKNRIAQVARDPSAFCMGLRAADGRWLSWISGWRRGKHTYIDWQCNRGGMERYSLSTAMRAYLLEHESMLRQSHIHFLGGTSHSMKYGFREDWCSEWLLTRHGWSAGLLRHAGPFLRFAGRLAARLGVTEQGRRAAAKRSPVMELVRRVVLAVVRISAR